jgi:sugar lactone lactonase YvrE/enterochelin esterase-like enzyme
MAVVKAVGEFWVVSCLGTGKCDFVLAGSAGFEPFQTLPMIEAFKGWIDFVRSPRRTGAWDMRGVATVGVAALSLGLPFVITPPRCSGADETSPAAPKGELIGGELNRSKIFPGTVRAYQVYVPKQYDPAKPACVHVNQDGVQFNAPAVFDELIYKKEIPVVIGVFVNAGVRPASSPNALPRDNRSYEYDTLNGDYARFLLEELFPEVERLKTSDGRPIRLSRDGNDRSIAGTSSGGICSFTAAWERPNEFRRVYSAVGSYAGFRGGNQYPILVRKVEPKPIRVFLQDGRADLNIFGGDWWLANQEMERALTFAGYEVNHSWGDGGHSIEHPTEVFPTAMRWLWKDWPAPVRAGAGSPQLGEVLQPGEGWTLVGDRYAYADGLAANAAGEVFFNDVSEGKRYKIGLDGRVESLVADRSQATCQAFAPDGRLYAVADGVNQIWAFDAKGEKAVIARGVHGDELIVRHDGGVFVTSPSRGNAGLGEVWFIDPKGKARIVDTGLRHCAGVTLSPDQSLLYVSDEMGHWVYSYHVEADGSLTSKQKYHYLHVPDTADDSGAGGMCVDRDGRLFVASVMGIQICSPMGLVRAIVPTPNGWVADVCFGGPDSDTLFAACGDRVYKRKLKVKGAQAFQTPIKPTTSGL